MNLNLPYFFSERLGLKMTGDQTSDKLFVNNRDINKEMKIANKEQLH